MTSPTKQVKHGTNSTYQNHKCRCQPCVKAHSAANRDWEKRQNFRKQN